MAIYEYKCRQCGRFETQQPIGTAAGSCACPECRRPAYRVFSVPHLASVPRPLAAALALEERSQEEPEVVSEVPSAASGPNPSLSRLPRP